MKISALLPKVLCVALATLGVAAAQAQSLPDPVRLVVGFPPGGTADIVARAYAEQLRDALGVNVVVENRPGAGGQIAAQGFLRSPTDGSVLLVANNHMMTTLPLTMKSVNYDPQKDFAPVAVIASFEHVLAVGKDTPASTLDEYVALVKKNPSAYGNYGIPAPGSAPQFVGFAIGNKHGLALAPVPYKGGAPLVTDLLGGHIPAGIDAIGTLPDLAKRGDVKLLAVTGPKRLDILKDIPTFQELGYPGLEASGWMGIYAPVGTDPALVQRLSQAFNQAAKSDKIAQVITPIGFVPQAGTPADLSAIVARDLDAWGKLVKESGFQPQ